MIEWQGKNLFSLQGVAFRTINSIAAETDAAKIQEVAVFKHPWMIDRYAKLFAALQPRNIFELGIKWGGSSAFLQLLADADKLVCIDIATTPAPMLTRFINEHRLEDRLKPYYGIDQSDRNRLREIAAAEFASTPLDLVLDDASHFLDESRASFNSLFPLLRTGGVYVIEDWPWAHAASHLPDDTRGLYPQREPLTKLIFEIVMACPSTAGMIEKIEIDRNSAAIWKGDCTLEPEGFDIRKCTLARGRNLVSSDY
jgi:cephalosporin hydroxylase